MMRVYRIQLGTTDKEIKVFPKIPDYPMNGEDNTTKRICVCPTILGCIKALYLPSAIDNYKDVIDKGANISVYYADIPMSYLYQPTEKEVPDVFETGELWITSDSLKYAIVDRYGVVYNIPYIQHMAFKLYGEYIMRRHMKLPNCSYSRFSMRKKGCEEVIDRLTGAEVYGDSDSFSFIAYDKSRVKEAIDYFEKNSTKNQRKETELM